MIRWLILILSVALPANAATEVREHVSPGGITFWMVEEPSIPIIAIDVSFRGGTSLDPAGKEGVTNLMTGLLEEGAGDLDAQAFLRAEESLAARFSYSARRDSVSISAEMLVENADASIDLLRLALTEPRFEAVDVARVKNQVLSSLAFDETDPDDIAGATFRTLSFPDHPYGTSDEGSVESVTALTQEDIVAAHQAAMVKDRMKVGVVGAVSPAEAGALLDRLLGDLPETGPALPPETTMAVQGGVTVVDLNVPQSVAIFGHAGMERDDPDFLTAYVLNEIFAGSGLTSRLTKEVREKRGLTYGVSANLAQVIGGVASANDRIAETIEVVRQEWARIGEIGVTAEELAQVKLFLTGSYALRFDSNMKIASNLVGLQVAGLPLDYIANRNELVSAVTLESCISWLWASLRA